MEEVGEVTEKTTTTLLLSPTSAFYQRAWKALDVLEPIRQYSRVASGARNS